MTLVLSYAARSDRGLVRSNNQDSVYAGPRLLALADGMGGHAAGEVASKVVIAALAPLDDDEPSDDLLNQLHNALISGNDAIAELVSSDPELDGMGTTLTAMLFAGSKVGLVHVGDSRAYLLREDNFSQITHDDTFVQSLIDEGRITEEEAANHPQRSLLLRALTGHDVEPSLAVREARARDRYLLCSDGLTTAVSEETITEALRIQNPQVSADRLIELALKGGGPDNVTVIVADVVDVEYGEDAPIVGGAAGQGDEDPQPDSSAARASAATRPPPQPRDQESNESPPPDSKSRRGRVVRSLLIAAGVLVVLAATAFGVRAWVLSQYYIADNSTGQVVIYQGVPGDVLGISLQTQVEGSCAPGANQCRPISMRDLQESARIRVQAGIPDLASLEQAREAMNNLRHDSLLPECAKPAPGGNTKPPSEPTKPGQVNTPEPSPTQTPLSTKKQMPGVNCLTVS